MSFSNTKFMKQDFQPRTAGVDMTALKAWFSFKDGEKQECEFKVRGLTGNEMSLVIEAGVNLKSLTSVIEAISNNEEAINEVKKTLGVTGDNTADIQKRMKQLELGCVEPKLELNEVVKLCEKFPVEFYILTGKITELTGLGMEIKK